MRMGVLGSGLVAQGLSARLADLGHNVVIGSFAETAAHGDKEADLLLWMRLFRALNTGMLHLKIMK